MASHIAESMLYGTIDTPSTTNEVCRGTIFEDSGVICMARFRTNAGANAVQADVTAVTCKVYNLDSPTPTTAVATVTVTVASDIFNTLQTSDTTWTVPGGSSTGYNFKHTIPASAFTTGDARYRIEYLFDMASGQDFYVWYEVNVVEVQA